MAPHRFDPNFTYNVINSMGPRTSPRLRQLMASLIRHVHDFARDNKLTVDGWMAGVQMLNWPAIDRLVDEITFRLAAKAEDAPTATAMLGPFFRAETPFRRNGDHIVLTKPDDGKMVFMHGHALDFLSGKPLVGATFKVWQAPTNGLYEQQDPTQAEFNLRGKFETDHTKRDYISLVKPAPTRQELGWVGPLNSPLDTGYFQPTQNPAERPAGLQAV